MNEGPSESSTNTQASAVIAEKNEQIEVWWLKRLKEHPFKALSLAVSVYGGLVLLAFFVWLGSMPELDIAGAAATLAAIAVIGLLVVVALAIITIAAGLGTRSLLSEEQHLTSRSSLLFLALPGGLLILFVGLDAAFYEAKHFSTWWIWGALGLSILLPVGRAACLHWMHKKSSKGCSPSPKGAKVAKGVVQKEGSAAQSNGFRPWGECVTHIMCGIMWLASALMAILSYFGMAAQSGRSNWEFGLGLAVWGMASVLLNILVVSVKQKKQWTAFITIGGVSVLIVTMLASNWSAIPVAVVRVLGLGDVPVGVVVTDDGCAIFNKAARGQQVCQMDSEKKLGWVCPVILKSRIGAPMVFELQSFGENGSWPISPFEIENKRQGSEVSYLRYQRIQLPKSDVKSWPSIVPLRHRQDELESSSSDSSPESVDGEGVQAKKSITGADSRLLASYLNQSYDMEHESQQKWLAAQCGTAAMNR